MRRWCCIALLAALVGCAESAPKNEVVVYVSVDRKDAEPILQRFEEQTGIRVRALYDAEAAKTTGLVTRLIAEAKRPRCDVFWNNEFVQTMLLADRELLQSYHSPAAEGVPSELRDADGRWTGIATRARVIVYNTELVKLDEVPRTLDELRAIEWKGKVAIASPMFGTTRTHIAALYASRGPAGAEAWMQALLDNDVRIVDGNAMVKNLVARANPNASPILFGLTDTDDVRSGQTDGEPIDFIYPDQDDQGTLVIPSTVCLLEHCPNQANGERLVDYLVSRETEALLTGDDTGYAPVRPRPGSDNNPPPRGMPLSYDRIHAQLAPSTEWVSRHFDN